MQRSVSQADVIPSGIEPTDVNDVMLNPLVFHQARKEYKYKPSVNLFANADHHQLPRYYSQVADAKADGVDAFVANWQAEGTPYANSPWQLIPRVLRKVPNDRVRIMMVVPDWEWTAWYSEWQALCEKGLLLTDPVYLDSAGRIRPKPRWNTRIGILNGQRMAA